MYLRTGRIRFFKIKNILLTVIAIANLIVSTAFEVFLVVRYRGDTYTIMHAKATPEFIFWIIAGPLMLIYAAWSSANIGDACFYSGYFEGDLDGYVSAEDLAEVTGRSVKKTVRQLKYFDRLYMKNYQFVKGRAELASKTASCDCLSCGAVFEKRLFFTGKCPYCGNSDLQARVLTDGKFYSISNELKGKPKNYSYYTADDLRTKKTLFPVLLGLSLFVILICAIMGIDTLIKYNDHDYLMSIVMDPNDHRYDLDRIRYDMIYSLLACFFIIAGLIPIAVMRFKKISCVRIADLMALFLTRVKTPFISAGEIPPYRRADGSKKINLIFRSLKKAYLRNCTIEKHGGELQVALAKKIVKDRCPNCGGAITGAVDKDYICRYCRSKIMDVVVKK